MSDDPGPAPSTDGRLHRTASLAEAVVSEGVTHWEDGDVLASFTEVELARRTLDATAAHLAHELERRGATHVSGGLGTSGWIAWHHGTIHRAGWGIDPDATHGFVVTTPTGRRLPAKRRGRVAGQLRA